MNTLSLEEKKYTLIGIVVLLAGLNISKTLYSNKSTLLALDSLPSLCSANTKNNISLDKYQKLTILLSRKFWGRSYSQSVRCREISVRLGAVVSLAFNHGFTYISNGLSIICASFTQKVSQITEFTSFKLELLQEKKDRYIRYLLCLLLISISHMRFYFCEYDISHLPKEMFENSSDKRNNEAFKLVISTVISSLFQPINNIAVTDRIWRKRYLPIKTFRCMNPLHMSVTAVFQKMHFQGLLKISRDVFSTQS